MKHLLSYKYKIVGLICILVAIALFTTLLLQGKQIQLPGFSALSTKTSYDFFQTIHSNIIEKFILLFFISGLSFIIFSKEKKETNCLITARNKALNRTAIAYIFWLLFSVFFIYGSNLHSILIPGLIMPFIIYLLFFYNLKNKVLKRRRLQQLQLKLLKQDLVEQTK